MKATKTLGAVIIAVGVVSCGLTVDGGSQTNWGNCTRDADCSGVDVCMLRRCHSPEAGHLAEAGGGGVEVPEVDRVAVDEPPMLGGRFGVAYRTKNGLAAFLEYVDGEVNVTPLGVAGLPRFAYDPAEQAIFVVPGASQADLDRINASVVPSSAMPVTRGDGPVQVVPVGPGRFWILDGTILKTGSGSSFELGLAQTLDGWRGWSLEWGINGIAHIAIATTRPEGAYVAHQGGENAWTPERVTSDIVALRSVVGYLGSIYVVHHCTDVLVRPRVGHLCYSTLPRDIVWSDGGPFGRNGKTEYGEWSHVQLGEAYKGYRAESPDFPNSPSATITLDAGDAVHVAFFRPAGRGFAIAYQAAPFETSAPEYLDDAAPLDSPELHVKDGQVTLVVRDAPERFTLYVKNTAGWHRARVGVPDLDQVGTVDIVR